MPLESNPDMFNVFARSIGLPDAWSFVDVLGMDEELLAMVPRPCLGVILLFEYSDKLLAAHYSADDSTKKQPLSSDIFFMKQFVGNACGTIAALHCLGNSTQTLNFEADSPMSRFIAGLEDRTPQHIGAALADFEEFHLASDESAEAEGQTEALDADDDTNHHFIAFVENGGTVYELDGAKEFPVHRGPSDGDLLKAA